MVRAVALCGLVLLAAACGGRRAAAPTGQFDVAIKVLKHGKQVIALVPVTIDGHGPYTFALDTGASQSLVDSSVARQLQVKQSSSTHKVAGVTSVAKVATIRVRHWQVGKVQLPATTVVEANLPFGNADGGVQGLLGSDMLSQFDVVTIDYAHGVLRLHHRG
jgi:predicted aspartyl protease